MLGKIKKCETTFFCMQIDVLLQHKLSVKQKTWSPENFSKKGLFYIIHSMSCVYVLIWSELEL